MAGPLEVGSEISDRSLDPVAFRANLVRVTELSLEPTPLSTQLGQATVIEIQRRLEERALLDVRIMDPPEALRRAS